MSQSEGQQTEDEEIAEMMEAFNMFDKNQDGYITKTEFLSAARSIGSNLTDRELQKVMKSMDKNGSEEIDFDEFKTYMKKCKRTRKEEEKLMIRAFEVFDRDKNGFIDAKELSEIMENLGQKLSDEQIDLMIKVTDKDGDNKIDYHEFAAFICDKPK